MARTVSLVYLAFLTVLLVVRNPLDWWSGPGLEAAFQVFGFAAHFVTLVVLGWLMLAARWSLHPVLLIALLVVYAGASELIQAPIPNRTPQWSDFLQDVAGLAVGMTLYWAWQRSRARPLVPVSTEVAAAISGD